MDILVAVGKIENLPEIEEGKELHIITPEDGMVPVALLSYKNSVIPHYLEKNAGATAMAVLIGMIVGESKERVKIYCPSDSIAKSLNGIRINGTEFVSQTAVKSKTGTKTRRTRKTAEHSFTEKDNSEKDIATINKEENEKKSSEAGITEDKEEKGNLSAKTELPLNRDRRSKLLSEAGIDKKFHKAVLEAVDASSDERIGLEIQLKMKLVAIGELDSLTELFEKVSPLFNHLRRMKS